MVKISVVRGMKVWSVEGKVTIAKCVKTGRFVKRAVAQKALDVNIVIVRRFAQVDATINWAAICASAFFIVMFALLVVFCGVMFTINPATVYFCSLIVVAFGTCFGMIVADNNHFKVAFN